MSSTTAVSSPKETERRVHARRRIEGLAYVDLGPDNGAILIDLGEGGLSFHSVAPVSLEQAVLVKFKLPKTTGSIESYAEVVWLNESGKGGGLRFVELKPELREKIGAWAGTVAAAEAGATEGRATEVRSEAEQASEASVMKEAENASVKDVPNSEPEPVRSPVHLAIEPASDEASEDISEDLAEINRGALAIEETEAEEALASLKGSEEQAMTAARTARAAIFAGEPAANKPSGLASNAPAKAHPPAGVPSEGITSRVHSGIMAASASESSAPASRVAPAAGPSTSSRGARAKQMSASPAGNSVFIPTLERGTATQQPRGPFANTHGEGARHNPSGARPSPVPARSREEWQAQAEELPSQSEEALSSQALKMGIGAGAGVILVLAIIAAVPSLRTRVLATTNAKSAATPSLPGLHEFQVEVADVNNRRWILKSGGTAGSPFVDTSNRRNAPPAAAPARKNAAKPEPPAESADAVEAPTPEIAQPRTANPAKLVLARPLKGAPAGSQAQNLPPSIFDGITPPIGSLAENLPVTGPNVPGPAPVQAGAPGGNLQAAVLLKRVAPVYPIAALKDGVKGEVRVKATISKDGVPANLTVLGGDARLIQAALEAIRQWRYRPATLEGQAIETTTTVSIAFQAN